MQKGEHESLHFLLLHTVRDRKREDAPGALIDSGDLIGFISQDVGPRKEAPTGRRPPPPTPIPTLLKEKACVIVFPPSSVSLSDGSCGIISNPRSLNNSSRAIYTQMESPLKSPPVSLSDAQTDRQRGREQRRETVLQRVEQERDRMKRRQERCRKSVRKKCKDEQSRSDSV